MRLRPIYALISLIVILPGVYSLIRFGLKLSIEFTGGSTLVVEGVTLLPEKTKELLKDYPVTDLTQKGNLVKLELKTITQQQANDIKTALSQTDSAAKLSSFETVGPVLGRETIRKTAMGLLLASLVILGYVAYVFKELKYGLSAVLAMLHDSIVLIGSFSLLGHFFGLTTDLLFVTAVLTTLSFSVHDTIVVYDRIRELSHKQKVPDFLELTNLAVSQTLTRSINNSLTIIFMLIALVVLGGDSIRGFAIALLIGTISGTYSSPFVAVPLITVWNKVFKSLR